MAPTLVRSILVNQTGSNLTSLVSSSFTPTTGNILVCKVLTGDSGVVPGTPTSTGLTWTSQATDGSASHCYAKIFTATGAGSAITVTETFTGSAAPHSMIIEEWSGAQLAGTPATNSTKVGSGAPSTTLTTVAANSIVSWMCGDWNAVAPGTPAYRSSATEDNGGAPNGHLTVSSQYTAYYAYQSAASAGSQTMGLTSPTGQAWSILGIEIQSAGGTSYTPSFTDAEGITDAIETDQANVREQDDPVGLTDTLAVAQGVVREQDDQLGITDALTSSVAATRTVADSVGLTDTASIVQAIVRGPSDNVGITDVASVAQANTRTITDAVGVTDALGTALAGVREIDDAVGITDSLSAVISGSGPTTPYNAFGSANPGLADPSDGSPLSIDIKFYTTLTGQYSTGARFYLDASSTGSLAPGELVGGLYATDPATGYATGALLATASFGALTRGAWNEVTWAAVPLTANTVYSLTVWAGGSHYFGLSHFFDQTSGVDIPAPSGASGLFLVEDTTSPMGVFHNGAFAEPSASIQPPNATFNAAYYGVDATLAPFSATNYTFEQDDTVGLTDTVEVDVAAVREQDDPIGISDAVSTSVGAVREVDDPVGITDSLTVTSSSGIAVNEADAVGLADALTMAQSATRIIADQVGLTDALTVQMSYQVVITDTIGITDTGAAQTIDYEYSITDPVGITDSLTVTSTGGTTYTPSFADPVGVTDQLATTTAAARSVADAVGITDSLTVTVTSGFVVAPADAVGITDVATRTLAAARQINDPLAITDTLRFVAVSTRTAADQVGISDTLIVRIIPQGDIYASDGPTYPVGAANVPPPSIGLSSSRRADYPVTGS